MSIHHQRRPYSTSPPTNKPPQSSQYSRSNFKILPFLSIIAIGTASYIFLAKSRAGGRSAAPRSQQ
jgi:hypothetical protein